MYQLGFRASMAPLGWAKPVGRFSDAVGYSHLASMFLVDSETQEYAVLHPLAPGCSMDLLGRFNTLDAFEAEVLKDRAFIDEILRPADLADLSKRLGKIGIAEVYYPVPYPCMGGSGALSSYDKGNVWVLLSLVAQTIGFA